MATIKRHKRYGLTVYGNINLRIPVYDLARIAKYIEGLLIDAGYYPQKWVGTSIKLSKCRLGPNKKVRIIERSKARLTVDWEKPYSDNYGYPRFHLQLLSAKAFISKSQLVKVSFKIHTDQAKHMVAGHNKKNHPTFREAERIEALPSPDKEP